MATRDSHPQTTSKYTKAPVHTPHSRQVTEWRSMELTTFPASLSFSCFFCTEAPFSPTCLQLLLTRVDGRHVQCKDEWVDPSRPFALPNQILGDYGWNRPRTASPSLRGKIQILKSKWMSNFATNFFKNSPAFANATVFFSFFLSFLWISFFSSCFG